jgi:hypothetical protein
VFWLLLLAGSFSIILQSCNEQAAATESGINKESKKDPFLLSDEFKNYWYAGKAEICSYNLKQARYGEIHDGSAVTIFVTEDLSKSKQVKLDDPESAGTDRLPVLKLNLTKKFNTGIYPYSMMLSVFSPVDINNYPAAVKISSSVQEWCGITYTQANLHNNKYEVQWNSYFEDEGDQHASFDLCIPEDELWNLVRIAPDRLPVGEQRVLPGSLYTRMTHIPFAVQTANITLKEDAEAKIYSIDYTTQKHTINIRFEKTFPYKILGWEETFPGFDGKFLTTTATLNKTLLTDYWNHHNNVDRVMREKLDLPKDF